VVLISLKLKDVFFNVDRGEAWLVLADEAERRGLPIFIGSWDTKVIAFGLRKDSPHPLTFQLMGDMLAAVGAELVEARITDLVESKFRAVIVVRKGVSDHSIAARPSDAVGLAACLARPIYAAETLMDTAGKELDEDGKPPELPDGFLSMRWMWAEDVGATARNRGAA